MNIEKRRLADLKPAEYSPRNALTPEDDEYQKIKSSIEQFGYIVPIIVNSDGTIIDGHQRHAVLSDLGYEDIEVVVTGLNKRDEKSLSAMLNKNEVTGYVEKKTIAQLFDLSGRRIEQLVADGVIERVRIDSGRCRFELDSTIQKYVKHLSDKAHRKKRSETEVDLKEQKLRAEVALKESQGELHRLRTEIATGNYISIEEVKADYNRFFIIFKNFALSMPSKMAGRLAGLADPVEVRRIENDLQKEVKKLLKDFVSRAIVADAADAAQRQENVTQPKRRGRPRKNAGA